jgi:non-canonical (house-cleaning) NTP pyrophosphatase
MWAAVTDGERLERAAGPPLRLLAAVADRVRAGAEPGPVTDDVLGEADVKRGKGAAGALTGGRVSRTEFVAGALDPFAGALY